jgi:RimJ/RimL family protein N-acetyltransferase
VHTNSVHSVHNVHGHLVDIREIEKQDRRALWEWRNDPISKNLLKVDRDLEYSKHVHWFDAVTKDRKKLLCVASVNTIRIGGALFELQSHESYSIRAFLKPVYWGQGYGPDVISSSIDFLRSNRAVAKVSAFADKTEINLRELFENAGLEATNETESSVVFETVFPAQSFASATTQTNLR